MRSNKILSGFRRNVCDEIRYRALSFLVIIIFFFFICCLLSYTFIAPLYLLFPWALRGPGLWLACQGVCY